MLDIKVLLYQELYLMMVLKLLCMIQNVIYTGIRKIDIPGINRITRLASYEKLGDQTISYQYDNNCLSNCMSKIALRLQLLQICFLLSLSESKWFMRTPVKAKE